MGTVKGPYSRTEWTNLLLLKSGLNFARTDYDRFRESIKPLRDLIKEGLRKEVPEGASIYSLE